MHKRKASTAFALADNRMAGAANAVLSFGDKNLVVVAFVRDVDAAEKQNPRHRRQQP